MKVVINRCYGGFGVSLEAARFMAERGHEGAASEIADYEKRVADVEAFKQTGVRPGKDADSFFMIEVTYGARWFGYGSDWERHDPRLVEAVEALGKAASGECADLKVVEIPDGVDYEIEEYDGNEHIAESHRTWR